MVRICPLHGRVAVTSVKCRFSQTRDHHVPSQGFQVGPILQWMLTLFHVFWTFLALTISQISRFSLKFVVVLLYFPSKILNFRHQK